MKKRNISKRIKDGYRYEQWCKWYLRMHGYHFVRLTKKSGDFGADIVCRSPILLIKTVVQCKHYNHAVGVDAVQQIVAAKYPYHAHRAIVMTNSTYTRQAVKLAKECRVKLLWSKGR